MRVVLKPATPHRRLAYDRPAGSSQLKAALAVPYPGIYPIFTHAVALFELSCGKPAMPGRKMARGNDVSFRCLNARIFIGSDAFAEVMKRSNCSLVALMRNKTPRSLPTRRGSHSTRTVCDYVLQIRLRSSRCLHFIIPHLTFQLYRNSSSLMQMSALENINATQVRCVISAEAHN
jgi:hypothetical protein